MFAYGYRLPFLAYPLRCFMNSNRFAMELPGIVNEAILELLHNDCAVQHNYPLLLRQSLICCGMEEAPLSHRQKTRQ